MADEILPRRIDWPGSLRKEFDTSKMEPGRYVLMTRGLDAAGNRSEPVSTEIVIEKPPEPGSSDAPLGVVSVRLTQNGRRLARASLTVSLPGFPPVKPKEDGLVRFDKVPLGKPLKMTVTGNIRGVTIEPKEFDVTADPPNKVMTEELSL